jgi:hypothetical protein
MTGLAVDFKPTQMTLTTAFEMIAQSGFAFDQLIHERTRDGANWIHVGLSLLTPRRQVLRASGSHLGGPMTYRRLAS